VVQVQEVTELVKQAKIRQAESNAATMRFAGSFEPGKAAQQLLSIVKSDEYQSLLKQAEVIRVSPPGVPAPRV
jgi:hypothetical protein